MVRKRLVRVSVMDYPEHLNPFREEEEMERRAMLAALEGRTTRWHLLQSPCSTLGRRHPPAPPPPSSLSPMSVRAASPASACSSGTATPVNGTLRRRQKRRAPAPPVPLSPSASVSSSAAASPTLGSDHEASSSPAVPATVPAGSPPVPSDAGSRTATPPPPPPPTSSPPLSEPEPDSLEPVNTPSESTVAVLDPAESQEPPRPSPRRALFPAEPALSSSLEALPSPPTPPSTPPALPSPPTPPSTPRTLPSDSPPPLAVPSTPETETPSAPAAEEEPNQRLSNVEEPLAAAPLTPEQPEDTPTELNDSTPQEPCTTAEDQSTNDEIYESADSIPHTNITREVDTEPPKESESTENLAQGSPLEETALSSVSEVPYIDQDPAGQGEHVKLTNGHAHHPPEEPCAQNGVHTESEPPATHEVSDPFEAPVIVPPARTHKVDKYTTQVSSVEIKISDFAEV